MSDKTRLLVTAALVGLGFVIAMSKPAAHRADNRVANRRSLARQSTHYDWDRLVGDEFTRDVQELEAGWSSVQAGQLIEQLHSLRQELTVLRQQHVVADGDSMPIDDNGLRNLAYFREATIRLRATLDGLSNLNPDLNLRELALRFSNARFIADDACDLQQKAHETVASVAYDTALVFESMSDLCEIEDGVVHAKGLLDAGSVPTPFYGGIELAAVAGYLKSCVQAA